MRITARGSRIAVAVNNQEVLNVDLDYWVTAGWNPDVTTNPRKVALKNLKREGHIVLQRHNGNIQFRNIWVKSLGGAGAVAPPADGGFVPLFNGKDLTGWKSYGDPKWTWANGRVLGSPTPGNVHGFLMTEAEFDDFELELQYRLAAGAGSGLFLRADPTAHLSGAEHLEVQIIDDEFPQYAKTPYKTGSVYGAFPRTADPRARRGDWNTLKVRLVGRHLQVWVNDTQTASADLDSVRDKFAKAPGLARRSGRIGLQQNQKSDVEFRSVRVKRLLSP
jgi:hypothetical protein